MADRGDDLFENPLYNNITLKQLRRLVTHYIDTHYTVDLSTTAPMISRYLRFSKGIEITGKFSTNDGTAAGRPMYVTILRQTQKCVAHDGYGFAVIKGSGDTYNVFLVDHNILTAGFTFGNFLQTPNINSFIQGGGEGIITAGKAIININQTYNFRLQINEDWSTDLRIWKGDEQYTTSSWGTMPDGALISGSLVDGPLGWGGRQIQSPITGDVMDLPRGTDFGIAIDNPAGYQWNISEVQVRKFVGGYPIQIFEFSNKNLITGPVQINYYGHAYDGTAISKLDVYIARCTNPNDSDPLNRDFDEWEWLGHTNVNGTIKRLRAVTADDAINYSVGNKFYIAVTAWFEPGTNLASTTIKTDYIEVMRAENRNIVDRSALDIWIDPINILSKTTSGEITLDSGGSTAVTEVTHPIFLIEKIYTTISPEVNLVDTGEIRISNLLNGMLYSDRDKLYLSHNPSMVGTRIKIDYWNCGTNGIALTNFVNNSRFRGPGQDILIRLAPPTVLKINSLGFSGPQTVDTIKELIVSYVNSLGTSGTIRKSDIVSLLYGNGVTKINLNTLDFEIIEYDYNEYLLRTFTLIDEFTRPKTPGRWFSHANYLTITKI